MALPFLTSQNSVTARGIAWFYAGLASSFPNIIGSGADPLSQHLPSNKQFSVPGCKVFHVPRADSSRANEVKLDDVEISPAGELQDQVLVFRYKGKFHAMDNKCPHSSYPLCHSTPFDIEDFGVVLSAGITCPKHGWSFDLFTGTADRGKYKLGLWQTELRPVRQSGSRDVDVGKDVTEEKEVWVGRKPRIG